MTPTKTVTAKVPWDAYQLLEGFGSIRFYGAPVSGVWAAKDQQWSDVLNGCLKPSTARIIKTVAEHTPPDLCTSQDFGTFGACRVAGGSQRKLFFALAAAPELARTKYRAAFTLAAASANPIDSPGLREAWWVCSRQPWALKIYFTRWAASILDDAWSTFKSLGWRSEIGLALCVRARNSSGTQLSRVRAAARARGGSEASQVRAGADAYAAHSDTYARRVVELYRDHGVENIGQKPDPVRELALDSKPRRQDGSTVPPFPPDTGSGAWLSLAALALALALVLYGAAKMRLI